MKKRKNVAIIGGLSDEKFTSKVQQLIENDSIQKVYLFRYTGNPVRNNKIKTFPFSRNSLFPRFIFEIFLFLYLFYLCLLRRIDFFVGIYFIPYGIYAGSFGKIFRIPVIQLIPGTDLNMILRYPLLQKMIALSSKIGVRGENSRQKLIKIGIPPGKIFIQHNLFNFEYYSDFRMAEKKYDLIFIGYVRRLKRIDVLLRAVHILKEEFPSLKCLLVGEGPERDKLNDLVNELEIDKNIVFWGFSSDVKSLLKQSKIFILTSQSEGLPMVIIEAMACGVPVVASAINDIPSVVNNNFNGFLVYNFDPIFYADACRKLLSDEVLLTRMSIDAEKSIKDKYIKYYSKEAIGKAWNEILGEI